ncbi:MAG: glycyl-radical enzyme activating protein [Blautia sp.]|nr:glycyl-radical enzyme activating protein [Blautia sp.]
MKKETAIVFNIQHYSLHDGPGIRTIVFFKGCPLRCRWCCNPESQRAALEVSYVKARCIGRDVCGFCAPVCPQDAIQFEKEGIAELSFDRCSSCMNCVRECPSKAIHQEGKEYTVEQLADIVERDSVFFGHGDGGLTVSGGEPLVWGSFLVELLKEARYRRIHTAIETCGSADYEVLKAAACYLDVIHYDIKQMDSDRHRLYTGSSNEQILSNFEHLCRDFPDIPKKVRTPVIPGFNDTPEDIRKIAAFVKGKPNTTYELLPYHRYGEGKYAALGRTYPMGDLILSKENFEQLKEISRISCSVK